MTATTNTQASGLQGLLAQRRFPTAISDLASCRDEAGYLATLPAPPGSPPSLLQAAAQLDAAITVHLDAAQARLATTRWRPMLGTTLIGSVMAHVHAAEALMLRRGDADYVLGKLSKIHADVDNHLRLKDPRRLAFEQLMKRLDQLGGDLPAKRALLEQTQLREVVITASLSASMAYRREYARMLSFRRGLTAWTAIVLVVGIGLGVWGMLFPTHLAVCFTPQGQQTMVCPTRESPFIERAAQTPAAETPAADTPATDTSEASAAASAANTRYEDAVLSATVRPTDTFLLLFVGMAGAAVSAAGAFRNVGGTATPFDLAIPMALLKLPLGSLIAVFGLLMIRGGFFPGLTALDDAPQIIAWAVVFGAAQQLFTGLVDRQAKRIQDQVGDLPETTHN